MIRGLVLRFKSNKPIVIKETDTNRESINYSLEMVGNGWTMYEQELINYEGEGKVKIDSALKESWI